MSTTIAGDPAATPIETVAVFAAPDAITAQLLLGALEAEGISAHIGEQVTDSMGGSFATGEGFWGEVRVTPDNVDAARDVVAAFEAGDIGVTDAEFDAQAESSSDPDV